MARPASRKAVSSLPAIANIDEQLDEVVMSDMQHVIRIIAHVVQALAMLIFLFLMWRWSRPQKKTEIPKGQAEAAERCVMLRNQLEKSHLEATLNRRFYK
jgi:hypothetical protein